MVVLLFRNRIPVLIVAVTVCIVSSRISWQVGGQGNDDDGNGLVRCIFGFLVGRDWTMVTTDVCGRPPGSSSFQPGDDIDDFVLVVGRTTTVKIVSKWYPKWLLSSDSVTPWTSVVTVTNVDFFSMYLCDDVSWS